MLERIRGYIFWICGGVVLLGAIGYIFALTGSGTGFFGDSEGTLAPTDFSTLSFQVGENGYLLCDTLICPNATANSSPANFPGDLRAIRLMIADFADDNPSIRLRSFNPASNQFEFIERSPGRPLPAVISVKLFEAPNITTNLAIYSYQPVGNSSADDHKKRVERWLKLLSNRFSRLAI